ncbi:MAG: hypothetical protein M1818_006797 [Claussenomyces sp. TS43310]|nr:MAG: hypothetical protein M1818_006797 [Claussenomyces sp. TS43310]
MGQLGGLSPEGSIAVSQKRSVRKTAPLNHLQPQIGIIVGLLSTSVQSLGLTLQRKSHILEDEKDLHDLRRPPYRRRRWQLGMGMFVIANLLGSTIQITTLPLPVLSTLQASGLVFNSICATLLLGEPFTRWSFGGTVLVCCGAVLIAIFGAIPEPAHNLNQLLYLLGRRAFILWMVGQAVLVLAIVIVATCLARFPSVATSPRVRLGRGLAYGCISGILSAHSLLVAKSAVELLVRTIIDGKNQFNRWQSWAILLGLCFLALTQLYYLHQGLKLVSTSVLYPLVFCIYNIIAILDGLIYFRQTDKLSPLHACLITLGTVILLSGVLALSWRLNDEQSQPAVAQSALAPGLGLVEDTDTEGFDEPSSPDEEATLGAEDEGLLNGEPLTPTKHLDTVLGATRKVRRNPRFTEADEIWSELADDDVKSPSAPRRRSSAYRFRPTAPQEHGDAVPDETTLLLESTTTQRHRRRKSTGFPGFAARSSPRSSKRKSLDSRGPLGNIFKLRWWRAGDKDPGQDSEGAHQPSSASDGNPSAS